MKLTLPRADLLKAIQSVVTAADRRGTVPALCCVLICADGTDLTLTATNLEIELRCRIHAATRDPGQTCVNARKLFDIVRSLQGDGDVTLTTTHEQLHVSMGRVRFQLAAIAPGDFPALGATDLHTRVHIGRDAFRAALDSTAFAAATDDVRTYLQGVLLDLDGANVTWVATNGHRMATTSSSAKGEGAKLQVIMPRYAVGEIGRLLGYAGPEELEIKLGERNLQVERGATRLTVRLLDAKYPNYREVIPAPPHRVTTNRQALLEALQRAAILADERFKRSGLALGSNTITITAKNESGDEAVEEVQAKGSGTDVRITINVDYLVEAVKAIDGEEAAIGYGAADTPLLVTGTGAQRHVVMPLRT